MGTHILYIDKIREVTLISFIFLKRGYQQGLFVSGDINFFLNIISTQDFNTKNFSLFLLFIFVNFENLLTEINFQVIKEFYLPNILKILNGT